MLTCLGQSAESEDGSGKRLLDDYQEDDGAVCEDRVEDCNEDDWRSVLDEERLVALEEGLEQCNSDTIQHMILGAHTREEQRKKQAKVCSTAFVLGEGCAVDG